MDYTHRLTRGGSFMTRFAHTARFRTTIKLISDKRYNFALDYGCADGWFLKLARQQNLVSAGVGIDIGERDLELCRQNFKDNANFSFMQPFAVPRDLHAKFDLAVCAETLEHVADAEETLDHIRLLCRAAAVVLLSVPIEVGFSLLVKQVGRRLAQMKNNSYDYERYTFQELMQAALLWNASGLDSSHRQSNATYRGHKGFDFRVLELQVRRMFRIHKTTFSPFPMFGRWLNSTVYWTCRLK